MIDDFFHGAGDIWRGFSMLLRHPGLWIWAIIPFLLNVVLFGLLLWGGWHFGGGWIERHMFAETAWWWDALGWILAVLLWLVMLLAVVFLFVPLASLLAAPFNDILSEKVEIILTGASVDESFSIRSLMRAVAVGLRTTIRLTLTTFALLLLVFPLNFIPGIGSLMATFLSTAITIRFLSLEYTSYSMDRRYYDYAHRSGFLRRNRARTIGLGAMAFLLMMVPVLNALFIPVSAVAGTLLFCDAELRTVSGRAGAR